MKYNLIFCGVLLMAGPVLGEMAEKVSEVWSDLPADAAAEWTAEEQHRLLPEYLIAAADNDRGYEPLFEEDLSDSIRPAKPWRYEGEILKPGVVADLWTEETYGDFILQIEFKCRENTNSGVFLRCGDIDQWLHTAIEVQILQPEAENGRHDTGAIYDIQAPTHRAIKPPKEWNQYTIIAADSRILVILNGERVNDIDLDRWTVAGENPDGSENKFRTAYRDMPRTGHIGLQYHGQPVEFRNARIKRL